MIKDYKQKFGGGVEMRNIVVNMNKPFYVGNAMLELSKFHITIFTTM